MPAAAVAALSAGPDLSNTVLMAKDLGFRIEGVGLRACSLGPVV
jgi:hypothetical protein